MFNILVVANDLPYPPNHGGRKDIWEQIKLFKKMGYKIDLLTTTNNNSQDQRNALKEEVESYKILKRTKNVLDFCSILPYQIKSRMNLKKTDLVNRYDLLILETEYVLPILWNKSLNNDCKIIYRMQNNEEYYFKSLFKSEKNLMKKLYFFTESFKFRYIKFKYLKKLKNIWFISKDEMNNFEYKDINGIFFPPQVNISQLKTIRNFNNNVLFIGSLFMTNNRQGITWYLNNVHDYLSKAIDNYKLSIAGNTLGESLDWLYGVIQKCIYNKNIKVFDSPKSLEDLYSQNSIFINPMLNGAGVKLKTIEAIKYGLPVVSTSVGIEGTGLTDKEHVLVGNDINSFKKNMLLLMNYGILEREQLVANAQKYIKEEFDSTLKIRNYINALLDK